MTSRRRKRLIYLEAAVPEPESITGNAVADAMLMLAVEKHVQPGEFRRHIELAQVAKEEMATGHCEGMEAAAREAFIDAIKGKKRK